MKKTILACLSFIMAASLFNVNAQDISYGVKAEMNMSNFLLKDMDAFKSTLKFAANPFARTNLIVTRA
jgi:hypothetical protein